MTTTPEHAKQHSPLPWANSNKSDPRAIFDAFCNRCATAGSNVTSLEQDEELAALIVNRVNAHDELVGALKVIVRWMEEADEDGHPCAGERESLERARAALAKAGK